MKSCLICLMLLTGLVHAQHSNLFRETKKHLERLDIEIRTAPSDIAQVEKLAEFQQLLRNYLQNAEPNEFIAELRELDPLIETIGKRSNIVYHRIFSHKCHKTYTVKDKDGNMFPVFTNRYRSNEELTAQEQGQLFQYELESYQKYGIHPKFELNTETLKQIEPDEIYKFVVTVDHTVSFAVEYDDPTIYRATDKGISIKRICSPNHTILAGNQPVLSAGTFTLWQEGEKQLFFIANDCGHHRADFESLPEFKKHLIKLGIDPERIIQLAIEVNFDRLLGSLRRKQERRKDEVVILRKNPIQ